MKLMKKTVPSVFLVFSVAMGLALGCAVDKPSKKDSEPRIAMEIVPEASISQFESVLGSHQKDPALIFTVGIQNVSKQPMRYRVNIFLLDMDKGAGSLVPAKGKPPVVQPGETETIKIPFIKTDKESKDILVVVKAAGY